MEQDAVTKIQQRLAELPADVQAAIQSSDLHTKITTIGGKYQLHIDQMGELEDEVMLAMLGFAPLEGLGVQLTKDLNLAPDVGEKLAADIHTQIFAPIRESMKAFAAKKAAAPATMPSAPAAVATPTTPNAPTRPPIAPDMHKADVVLTQPTVSTAPASPKATQDAAPLPSVASAKEGPIYKADPYREPIQ